MRKFTRKLQEFDNKIKELEALKAEFIKKYNELENYYSKSNFIDFYPTIKFETDLSWMEQEIYQEIKVIRDEIKQVIVCDNYLERKREKVIHLYLIMKDVSIKKGYSEYFIGLLQLEVRYLINQLENKDQKPLANIIREVFDLKRKS